jgi:chemotaxis protein histidine kinase CheA
MRERAGNVGGSLQIESSIGKGTSITVKVPLSPQMDAAVDANGREEDFGY